MQLRVLHRIDVVKKGEKFFKKALKLYRIDDYEGAIEYIDDALIAYPDNYEYNVLKGHILYRIGSWFASMTAYKQAIEINPSQTEALKNISEEELQKEFEYIYDKTKENEKIDPSNYSNLLIDKFDLSSESSKIKPQEERRFIYFIRCNNYVKIGNSNNPEARLKSLQVGNPYKLELLLFTTLHYEYEIHQKFSQYNIIGEWFELSEEIIKFINQLIKNR